MSPADLEDRYLQLRQEHEQLKKDYVISQQRVKEYVTQPDRDTTHVPRVCTSQSLAFFVHAGSAPSCCIWRGA